MLLSITAKQLPSFGASLETAVPGLGSLPEQRLFPLGAGVRGAAGLGSTGTAPGAEGKVGCGFPDEGAAPAWADGHHRGAGLVRGNGVSIHPTAVITEGDPRAIKKPRARKDATNRQKLKSYADLSPGDLVVHEHHGVGRYVGMVKMQVDGVEKDYVKIAYAGTDVLYVPATQLDMVSKYIGGGEDAAETKS